MSKVRVDISKFVAEDADGGDLLQRSVFADRAEMLRARVDILSGTDGAIMKMYLDGGCTYGQIARLMGVNEATVARRIRKITKRLLDGEYITCLHNRMKLNPLEQRIAKDHFLDGLSQRNISLKRSVSIYHVRMGLKRIQKIVAASGKKDRRHNAEV